MKVILIAQYLFIEPITLVFELFGTLVKIMDPKIDDMDFGDRFLKCFKPFSNQTMIMFIKFHSFELYNILKELS